MFTVKEELKLPAGEAYDVTKYPSDGLFLVDDGISYILASVENGMVMSMPIPREYIVKHKQMIGESGIDLLQKQLAELNFMLKTLTSDQFDMFNKVLDVECTGGSDINVKDLTEMIAVAQDSKCFKKD